jgi:hypothetical protein
MSTFEESVHPGDHVGQVMTMTKWVSTQLCRLTLPTDLIMVMVQSLDIEGLLAVAKEIERQWLRQEEARFEARNVIRRAKL